MVTLFQNVFKIKLPDYYEEKFRTLFFEDPHNFLQKSYLDPYSEIVEIPK